MGSKPGFHAVFGQRENRGFRVVQNGVGAVFALEGALLDVVRGVNQIAQHRLFFDDARVMLDVRDLGHAIDKRSQIRRAAGSFQFAAAMQLFGQRDQVDGLLGLAESNHLRENAAVLSRERNPRRSETFDGGVQGVVVEQNGAEDGALGLEIVRKGLFESGIHGHSRQFALDFRLFFAVVSFSPHEGKAEFSAANPCIALQKLD